MSPAPPHHGHCPFGTLGNIKRLFYTNLQSLIKALKGQWLWVNGGAAADGGGVRGPSPPPEISASPCST